MFFCFGAKKKEGEEDEEEEKEKEEEEEREGILPGKAYLKYRNISITGIGTHILLLFEEIMDNIRCSFYPAF